MRDMGVELQLRFLFGWFQLEVGGKVYLEIPNGEKIAQALQAKGTPYVIYWKNAFSSYEASHFRQALLSVVQRYSFLCFQLSLWIMKLKCHGWHFIGSSCSHAWDAFQLAHASFRLYCVRNNYVMPANMQKDSGELGPHLLGSAPQINILIPERVQEDGEEIPSDALPVTKIYDDDVDMRLLVCGVPCTVDACLAGSLEDGLNALLNIEVSIIFVGVNFTIESDQITSRLVEVD
ncbi:hypothetical protein BHE74_00012673 [Ensete ventricosum]|nr:hypothetical protein BHE74_00012673 [Ensete ventricosum]RZR91435.1 hypothetical protein BHM03_00019549 [Ensete ventricosum]